VDENEKRPTGSTSTSNQPQSEADSPITPKTAEDDLPPVNEKEDSKEPFYKKLRKGSAQFSAMPSDQTFNPPLLPTRIYQLSHWQTPWKIYRKNQKNS